MLTFARTDQNLASADGVISARPCNYSSTQTEGNVPVSSAHTYWQLIPYKGDSSAIYSWSFEVATPAVFNIRDRIWTSSIFRKDITCTPHAQADTWPLPPGTRSNRWVRALACSNGLNIGYEIVGVTHRPNLPQAVILRVG